MQGGQPVQYASRALTESEKHHSQIEKEMLSVVFGLTRFHTYTYIRKVTVHNQGPQTTSCGTQATRWGESHSTSENAAPNYGI